MTFGSQIHVPVMMTCNQLMNFALKAIRAQFKFVQTPVKLMTFPAASAVLYVVLISACECVKEKKNMKQESSRERRGATGGEQQSNMQIILSH